MLKLHLCLGVSQTLQNLGQVLSHAFRHLYVSTSVVINPKMLKYNVIRQIFKLIGNHQKWKSIDDCQKIKTFACKEVLFMVRSKLIIRVIIRVS